MKPRYARTWNVLKRSCIGGIQYHIVTSMLFGGKFVISEVCAYISAVKCWWWYWCWCWCSNGIGDGDGDGDGDGNGDGDGDNHPSIDIFWCPKPVTEVLPSQKQIMSNISTVMWLDLLENLFISQVSRGLRWIISRKYYWNIETCSSFQYEHTMMSCNLLINHYQYKQPIYFQKRSRVTT